MRALLSLILLLLSLFLLVTPAARTAPTRQTDANYPFRTDFANANLPWYRLKPGEFPPYHSEHRVGGELVEADYIHRSGVLRMDAGGELVNFTLLPFGSVYYLNAEADLRDVPLGTHLLFCLYQDDKGEFTRVATMQDETTLTANHGFSYRLNQVNVNKASTNEANVNADNYKLATEQQRKRHFAFLKARGVPAWIDRVEGNRLTVTLFSGDPASLQALFKAEGIDPALWAKEHRRISVAVANEHLRTYRPDVTDKWGTVQEFQSVPADCYGCSGVRWVIQPELMLEGFRKGHIVRLFADSSWPIESMPFGEGLYAGGHDEEPADSKELQPADFPYRTDFGNENLPWYQLQPGKFPPDHSEHRVGGELVKVDAAHHSGQFRLDRTGELLNFTLIPVGKVLYLNADAALEDLPLGMRCLFFLYQDEKGAFTRAAVVMDEYSYLASNTLTYRLEAAQLSAGKLIVARHAAPVKVDYVLEPRVPTDFGRLELEVDAKTRVWKGDRQVKLTDLAVGDELLVNLAARTTTSRGRCTDIWVGPETFRLATEQQRKRHAAYIKEHGV